MSLSLSRTVLPFACATALALALCGCSGSATDDPDSPVADANHATRAADGDCFSLLFALASADGDAVDQDPESVLDGSGYSYSIDTDAGRIGITPDDSSLTDSMTLVSGSSETGDPLVVDSHGASGYGYPAYCRSALWTTPAADTDELEEAALALCSRIGVSDVLCTYSYNADSQCYALVFAACTVNGMDSVLEISAMQPGNNPEVCSFLVSFTPLGSKHRPETSYDDVVSALNQRYGNPA